MEGEHKALAITLNDEYIYHKVVLIIRINEITCAENMMIAFIKPSRGS